MPSNAVQERSGEVNVDAKTQRMNVSGRVGIGGILSKVNELKPHLQDSVWNAVNESTDSLDRILTNGAALLSDGTNIPELEPDYLPDRLRGHLSQEQVLVETGAHLRSFYGIPVDRSGIRPGQMAMFLEPNFGSRIHFDHLSGDLIYFSDPVDTLKGRITWKTELGPVQTRLVRFTGRIIDKYLPGGKILKPEDIARQYLLDRANSNEKNVLPPAQESSGMKIPGSPVLIHL